MRGGVQALLELFYLTGSWFINDSVHFQTQTVKLPPQHPPNSQLPSADILTEPPYLVLQLLEGGPIFS